MGRKKQIGPEKFFQAQPSKTELRARYSTMAGLESLFWRGIRWRKEGGGKKKLSGPESLCLIWASETRQHRQDKPRQANTSQHKPTQAKGSLQGQMTFSESGWCLAEAVNVDSNLPGAEPCLSSAWKFRGTYSLSFFREIAANNQCVVY